MDFNQLTKKLAIELYLIKSVVFEVNRYNISNRYIILYKPPF